jgi:hypothetical protein
MQIDETRNQYLSEIEPVVSEREDLRAWALSRKLEGMIDGEQRGREVGLVEGEKRGLAAGEKAGREKGLLEGEKAGREKGMLEGEKTGREQWLLEGEKRGEVRELLRCWATGQKWNSDDLNSVRRNARRFSLNLVQEIFWEGRRKDNEGRRLYWAFGAALSGAGLLDE